MKENLRWTTYIGKILSLKVENLNFDSDWTIELENFELVLLKPKLGQFFMVTL
jgi:hypothetical protein